MHWNPPPPSLTDDFFVYSFVCVCVRLICVCVCFVCVCVDRTGWRPEHLTQMCIFAGCDYLKSLSGMGIKKAYNTMQAVNLHRCLVFVWCIFALYAFCVCLMCVPFCVSWGVGCKVKEVGFHMYVCMVFMYGLLYMFDAILSVCLR